MSNRSQTEFWGKNQFNSSFPAALACYMRDQGLNPVYLQRRGESISACDESLTFDDVFGTSVPCSDLTFLFETRFQPYEEIVYGSLDGIDLVIAEGEEQRRALEVKLTVLPDQTTYKKSSDRWGTELVIRPVSVVYAALSIYSSHRGASGPALEKLKETGMAISDWTNPAEVLAHKEEILNSVQLFLESLQHKQQPLILQPIWKTQGKQPALADQAFDIFIWSDMALCQLFLGQAFKENPNRKNDGKVSRYLRASTRLLRSLYELYTTGKIRPGELLKMGLGNQTDKEFSASGTLTNPSMAHPRLVEPIVPKTALKEIILRGGEKCLSPERRFDASIYFTAEGIFESE